MIEIKEQNLKVIIIKEIQKKEWYIIKPQKMIQKGIIIIQKIIILMNLI